MVVIGYTNERITRGWADDARYFVHGAYRDADVGALLGAYRAEIVLFPNRLPESFSYTLSEVWAAGMPVIVPDHGALGERVARHGGGWRLPAGFDASVAAALIRRLFTAEGESERARVKSQIDPHDNDRIPTTAAMSRALDSLYQRFAVPAPGSGDPATSAALAPLLAANLDGFAFRAELLNLAEELDNARDALGETRRWASDIEANAKAWAQKLERDIETLRNEVAARDAVLSGLPAPLRRWLLSRARRDRR